ncbi:MAG: kinase/pyrophosphorylase [Alphaproteobacteria bacterium]|nr:kinase/pyrophosphorylase [Alphaproteobacteria bacterium]
MTKFNLHLVSDATGETLEMVAKAVITQFEGYQPIEHVWTMVRTPAQLQVVIDGLQANPGVVMFTLVNRDLQRGLINACRSMETPWIDVLDPAISTLRDFLQTESKGQPGRQHVLDEEYFKRIEAMQFCLAHDDGQSLHDLDTSDVVLVGVSRTSKTPTCMYLANRGAKAANVPLVPDRAPPEELITLKGPLVVGLVNSVNRLAQIRRNRLLLLKEQRESSYVDEDSIRAEVTEARRLFSRMKWPTIDVTGRSIEETAATILKLLATHQGAK